MSDVLMQKDAVSARVVKPINIDVLGHFNVTLVNDAERSYVISPTRLDFLPVKERFSGNTKQCSSSQRLAITVMLTWKLAPSLGSAIVYLHRNDTVEFKLPMYRSHFDAEAPMTLGQDQVRICIGGVPRTWDEDVLAKELGLSDKSSVYIQRRPGTNGRRPPEITAIIQALRPCVTSTTSRYIGCMGICDIRVVGRRNIDDVSRALQTLPMARVFQQPLRAHLRIDLINYPPDVIETLGVTQSFTCDTWNSAWNLQTTLNAVSHNQALLDPDVVYDPVLTRLRGIKTIPSFYIDHRRGSPLLKIYGPPTGRQKIVDSLVAKCHALSDKIGDETCGICFRDATLYPLMACNHRLCRECLSRYMTTLCQLGKVFVCPFLDCGTLVSWQEVNTFGDPQALLEWANVQVTKLARKGTLLQLCPGPCGNILTTRPGERYDCPDCDAAWCLKCSRIACKAIHAHRGDCDLVARRAERRREVQDLHLTGVHPCPTCATPIEKTTGCSHMTCTVSECNTHFCWGCLQQFSTLGGYDAQGHVIDIDEDKNRIVVQVDPKTWSTPDLCPPPEDGILVLNLKSVLANHQLPEVKVGTTLVVETEIYNHANTCAKHINT